MQMAAGKAHLVVGVADRFHAAEGNHLAADFADAGLDAFALAVRPDGADAALDVQADADVVKALVQRHQFEALAVAFDDFGRA